MEKRAFGKTGLEVTVLGLGAGQIGLHQVSDADSERLFNGALDLGMNVIDTAAVYGSSEEKIGKYISNRRDEYVLISKCGQHMADGEPPAWSAEMVRWSLERSLRRMKTDHLDVFLLHSCAVEQLQNQEMLDALYKCREDGLARFIGYSGDDKPLFMAIDLGTLDCVETSVQLFDQQAIDKALPKTTAAGLGVIAKKGMANAVWRIAHEPGAEKRVFVGPYVHRFRTMNFTPESIGFDGDWDELALRFSAWQDGVHTTLVGGTNFEHTRRNAAIVDKGPLPFEVLRNIRHLWEKCDDGSWIGQP